MLDIKEINVSIENLREELGRELDNKYSKIHEDEKVIELSRKLDVLIVDYIKGNGSLENKVK